MRNARELPTVPLFKMLMGVKRGIYESLSRTPQRRAPKRAITPISLRLIDRERQITIPVSAIILNSDKIMEAFPPERVTAFQTMLCNACQRQNAGECVRDTDECPVDTVTQAYKRAS